MKLIFSVIAVISFSIISWVCYRVYLAHSEPKVITVEQQLTELLNDKQQLTYVDFWASWCTPCLKSFPALKQTQQQFSGKGFTVISINLDAEQQNADNFLAQQQVNFPVIFDPTGSLAAKYKVQGLPTGLLFDNQGKLIWQHQGFKAGDHQLLINKITGYLTD